MAKWSRGQYEPITEVLKLAMMDAMSAGLGVTAIINVTTRLAIIFEQDNRAFSKERFFQNIGIPMEEAEENGTTEGR